MAADEHAEGGFDGMHAQAGDGQSGQPAAAEWNEDSYRGG
jgi:hypothetical protein